MFDFSLRGRGECGMIEEVNRCLMENKANRIEQIYRRILWSILN